MKPLSSIVNKIDLSAIKRIELFAKNSKDVITLAQGTPSFFTTPHIRQAAKDAIDSNLVDKYTPGYGIEPLRIAISQKLKKKNNILVSPSQVIVTHGAIEGLMAIFMTLLDPSDDLLIPTPDYASHLTQVRLATGGKPPLCVPLDETEKGWILNTERLEKQITSRTKAILICDPSNPTGKVYSIDELKEIVRIAIKYNLYIVTDEMYEDFLFDNKKHVSIASFKEVRDRTISVFGVSKSYAMTGWRIGYIVAQQKLIDQIFKIHDCFITCPTAVSQYAALSALTGDQSAVSHYKKAYEKRRQITMDALKKTDALTFCIPEGAYYIFPKLTGKIDDNKLCMELLKKAGVAVVPGSAFGKGGENHIRISFACNEETLREGLKRLVNYLDKIK